jgi:hypothetical protein
LKQHRRCSAIAQGHRLEKWGDRSMVGRSRLAGSAIIIITLVADNRQQTTKARRA